MARGQGFEPRLPGPKPGVLPLDDPRTYYFKALDNLSYYPSSFYSEVLPAVALA